jgi:hypothetical protein
MPLKKYMALPDTRVTKGPQLVVSLLDDFTGRGPIGKLRVFLKEQTVKIVKNISGYYLFSGVYNDVVHVLVKSAYYFAAEREVNISQLDPKHPLITIRLQPTPFYPFPSGTTLIRGIIKDSQGNLLPGAIISIEDTAMRIVTDNRGEFVCSIVGLREEDIVIKKGKRILNVGKGSAISLLVTYQSMSKKVKIKNALEGEVTVLESPIILK